MANINNFKYVKSLSKKMYSYIPNIQCEPASDIEKERLGFYHLVLEKITGVSDAIDIQKMIQDQAYLKAIGEEPIEDHGIDAVYIDKNTDTNKRIYLFNFKYREKFNPDKTIAENDVFISSKFFQYIIGSSSLPTSLTKESKIYTNISEIKDCLESNDIYDIILYMVSNEANGFSSSSQEVVSSFADNYGMQIETISLDDIMMYLSERPHDINAKLLVNSEDIMTYSGDVKSTEKSYICKVSLLDIIRITNTDSTLRNEYNVEDDKKIEHCNLEFSILYDNVRGYLGQTSYNKKIYDTIKNDGKNFFLFNNGITITCSGIESESKNSNKKYLISLSDFQVVNGGQTLRSIYNYLENSDDPEKIEKLRDSCVLIRIFKIDSGSELKNRIAEYTNSQNAISPIDLKSVSKIQIDLEQYLKAENILYIRKAGDVGDTNNNYAHRISMEKFTQILYSSLGYPETASNAKKKLFSEFYDTIYSEKNFKLEDAKPLIELYDEINNYYKTKNSSSRKSVYDQKVFYIIYIIKHFEKSIEEADEILTKALTNYNSTLSESRVLLKTDFRKTIADFANKSNNL